MTETPASTERFDVVYVWIDPIEHALAWSRAGEHEAGPAEPPADASAYDNLRYSLRSLDRFAPWIHRIFIVTVGGPPAWLEIGGRLTCIDHRELLPATGLRACFNANAIEWTLTRIPGLSRRFIYWQDCQMLDRPVTPADFATDEGGARIFFDARMADGEVDVVRRRAAARTMATLGRAWRRRRALRHSGAYSRRLVDRLWFPAARRLHPARVPQLYDRETLAALRTTFAADVERTMTHPFESADDLLLPMARAYYLLEASADWQRHDVVSRSGEPGLLPLRVKSAGGGDRHIASASMRWLLESAYPQPSSFEPDRQNLW